ncbi:hypothetical protein [Salininema proteolyticum]|uniref:Thioredoxin-like fold domain-containing protein n=1 Tax=Salininema proteolyticum TaxID=1607685 RepID=A0ABV8TW86_9ACTN
MNTSLAVRYTMMGGSADDAPYVIYLLVCGAVLVAMAVIGGRAGAETRWGVGAIGSVLIVWHSYILLAGAWSAIFGGWVVVLGPPVLIAAMGVVMVTGDREESAVPPGTAPPVPPGHGYPVPPSPPGQGYPPAPPITAAHGYPSVPPGQGYPPAPPPAAKPKRTRTLIAVGVALAVLVGGTGYVIVRTSQGPEEPEQLTADEIRYDKRPTYLEIGEGPVRVDLYTDVLCADSCPGLRDMLKTAETAWLPRGEISLRIHFTTRVGRQPSGASFGAVCAFEEAGDALEFTEYLRRLLDWQVDNRSAYVMAEGAVAIAADLGVTGEMRECAMEARHKDWIRESAKDAESDGRTETVIVVDGRTSDPDEAVDDVEAAVAEAA